MARCAFACLTSALLAGPAAGGSAPGTPAQEGPAEAVGEEILLFRSTIRILPDATMRVTEEITVRALGHEIRRGIYRDFPTSFPRGYGLARVVAPFEVIRVQRDGAAEPYTLSTVGGGLGRAGVRVRIGREDRLLEPGVHTYLIEYETARWLAYGDEDELYWNVTGHGWSFPIGRAEAEVRVEHPPGGPPPEPVALEGWTGPLGSTASNLEAIWDAASGVARFVTTQPLGPREGLTIRARYPGGTLPRPGAGMEELWFRMDWGGLMDAGAVVGLVTLLYLLLWVRVGRDPAAGPVVVRYTPPEGFSAPALGYLRDRGYEDRQLAAALVDMAVRGAVRLEKDGDTWAVVRAAGPRGLPPEERAVYARLLRDTERRELGPKEAKRVRAAAKALARSLKRSLERTYFVTNRGWFAAGLVMSVVGVALLLARHRYAVPPAGWFLGLWLAGWTAGTVTMLLRAVTDLRVGLGTGRWRHTLAGTVTAFFSLPFVAAWVFAAYLLFSMVPTYLVVGVAAVGAVNMIFYHLLEAPTLRGRGVLDQLEGFARFLGATEEDRLDRTMDPAADPGLFERYLPHAIALGLENRWAERFQTALTPAKRAAAATPVWLAGVQVSDVSGLTSDLGPSLTSTLSSLSAPPALSGGGGGGGFSGGGGGGGGGGGW